MGIFFSHFNILPDMHKKSSEDCFYMESRKPLICLFPFDGGRRLATNVINNTRNTA
jgi:hypothetical protein